MTETCSLHQTAVTPLTNLLSGVRVTDVNTEATRAAETRAALEEVMRSHPHLSQYNEFYVHPEDVPNLTPEDILLMRKYTEMNDAARKVASDRRKRGNQR